MIPKMPAVWRAGLLSALLPAALAARTTDPTPTPMAATRMVSPDLVQRYAAPSGEKFEVDAVDLSEMDPKNLRQLVDYRTTQPPGTVVVGKAGLEFSGTVTIQDKKEWPHWTPTQDMMRREPDRYQPWTKGMDGGAKNPLGARALYLFKDGKDTLYRIHGTTEPWSIGKAVSSGCIRMLNPDVIALYNRVSKGAKVVVL